VRALRASLAVVATALTLAACGGSSDEPAASPATTGDATTAENEMTHTETEPAGTDHSYDVDAQIDVVDGQPAGGKGRIEAKKGDHVRIEVTVDAPQEIHLHGYDIETEASPDEPGVLDFEANLDGIFTLESHVSEAVLADIVVEP
jgi:FtsP/CotA-like multicopper oxidase with cupredoxin domain